MKKKGNEMESICSSSSNARLLTNEIESTCSSSSNARLLTKACNSVNASCCSSNRTHIKRPRFHMAQLGVKIKKSFCDEAQKFLGDCIPNSMFGACNANRDAFIKLLLSACDGTDNTMGSPDMPEIFWEKFTKRWVHDLKLDIVITEETVATCEIFGSSLKDLHLGMEKTSRAIEKHRREQLCQPLQLKQSLFKVFGTRKPCFRRKNSTSKSSRSSKSARSIDASRLSDASGPSGASQSLRQDVNDVWNEWEPRLSDSISSVNRSGLGKGTDIHQALSDLVKSGKLEFNDVERAIGYICKSKTHLKVFLKGDEDLRAKLVNEGLNQRGNEDLRANQFPDTEIPDSYRH